MHVVEPDKFPLDAAAKYTPKAHTLAQASTFLNQLGIKNMVIVQPSIYGNDNSCTLDGLKNLGPKHGRAVIQFDPAVTSKQQLQEWHEMGVRGVRINFKSVGAEPTAAELESTLREYADAVRSFGWPLELYIALENVPMLESFVDGLGVKIIVDHLGHPTAKSLSDAQSAHDIAGFSSLLNLLKQGNTWVKMSATYRLSSDPSNKVIESLCKETLRARPDRIVFATDWPHTRFDNIDVSQYLEKVLDWIDEEGVSPHQVLVKNAEELFNCE
ncbi:related to TIM barrel metal-dependent hydrolase [Ramularia collo-cygni]|uniref:Related to TIM barrel metal-dependent hydrolase n=1 Tax=Ramularia collo-cygni TaxID=112498 RepID=A0A2D3V2B2_9PEZI|nr:related to TIM barrel metal-dependent hydrolase [Ramularia collo-cygni]CZT24417.1 related to TIM barrel metal-dependent hydrolase [Ramularia collo-cygni]